MNPREKVALKTLPALDDPDLQQAVLERLTDTEMLLAAHAGMCGETARSWAKARFDTLLEMAVEEASPRQ